MSLLLRFPKKVPVIIQKSLSCTDRHLTLPKSRYLVPKSMSVAELLFYLRYQLHVPAHVSIFIWINDKLPSLNHTMGLLFEEENINNRLYLYYGTEHTFG